MDNTTPSVNPFDRLLDLLCFPPLGLVAFLLLLVLPLVPPFNQEYLIRWLISAAFIASLAVAFDFTAGLINIVNFGYCAIMGLALLAALKNFSFLETVIYGVGSGLGFTLAIVLMAGIREQLDLADVPEPLKGAGIALIVAGIMALAFTGFSGMIN